MSSPTRRTFLKQTAAASTLAWAGASVSAAGANERISIAVLGTSRGLTLAREFVKHGQRLAYVCDVDSTRAARAKSDVGAEKSVGDLRRVLDDKSVDAVAIATPDHWHAPATILACEAGKHVYVEKPCAHNIREGRLMIEAARRTKRVVQVGTQSRSTKTIQNAMKLLHEGAIGEVLLAKAWNSQRRGNIGHAKPSDPPAGFDHDLWIGPAPMRPFQSNRQHYNWHWWYDFGTGDAGNDGVHDLDIALWGLGVNTHPTSVAGHCSKLYFDDDQQFPDTQNVTFEFAPDKSGRKKQLIYEHRIWAPYPIAGHDNGNAFYGTKGWMELGKKDGWKLYGPRNKLIDQEQGTFSVTDHTADFLQAVRSGKRPNADIEIGHRSAALAHLANILARTGRHSLDFDPHKERFPTDTQADAHVSRSYRENHWAVPKGV